MFLVSWMLLDIHCLRWQIRSLLRHNEGFHFLRVQEWGSFYSNSGVDMVSLAATTLWEDKVTRCRQEGI